MMVPSTVHNQPSGKQRSMHWGAPPALRASRLRRSSRNIFSHWPLFKTCIPRTPPRSLSGRRSSRPRRGGRQRGLTPNASMAAGVRSSRPSMATSRAPLAGTFRAPGPPRLADAQRGQAGRRQSRPVASSPLRPARLSTHHPLPWLIIDSTRPGEREQKIPSPWRLSTRQFHRDRESGGKDAANPLLGRVMQINLSDGWQALFPPSHPLSQGARGTFPALSRRERGAGGRVRALMAPRGGACGLICITRLGGVPRSGGVGSGMPAGPEKPTPACGHPSQEGMKGLLPLLPQNCRVVSPGGRRYAGRDRERCEIEPLRPGFLLLTNAPAFFNRPLHARYFFSLRQMAAARACRVWNWIDCRAGRV